LAVVLAHLTEVGRALLATASSSPASTPSTATFDVDRGATTSRVCDSLVYGSLVAGDGFGPEEPADEANLIVFATSPPM